MGEARVRAWCTIREVVLSLVAFGFSIAAERRQSTGIVVDDWANASHCVYNSDVATGYGVGGLLVSSFKRISSYGSDKMHVPRKTFNPRRKSSMDHHILHFVMNAYHTKYRDMIYAQNFWCETVRKGVFIAGAVFVVGTMILDVYYYMYFTKAVTTPA